ncbi:MAG: (Fe-S)-binding protein [Saprospiraceae bacterium]|nr:(Fe-S)-binding protein [Saprospiraceae bacterium]
MIQPIIFGLITLATGIFSYIQYSKIYKNIKLGKDLAIAKETRGERIKNTVLIALGQKKMFKRPLVAFLHLFIYVAFIFTQIELIEILIDGFTGAHRFFQEPLGGLYTVIISTIEVLSVLALIGTIIFLARRNLLKIPRFQKDEMTGWPKLDGNIILILEIFLVFFIFLMNSADMAHSHGKYGFLISDMIYPIWENMNLTDDTLIAMERVGWWGHILVVFAFLNYLPISKHLHILLAFPNVYFAKLNAKGEMDNMPDVQKEVASMFDEEAAFEEPDMDEEIPKFGASDVTDLNWTSILAAYTCTECGRCTSMCPANLTGKKLSPRKVMMDVRDRADEIGKNIQMNNTQCISEDLKTETSVLTKENYDDGKSLFDYITEEELRACTTCNACVEACPVMINPLDIIVELRRNLILDKSESPEEWNAMFNTIENNGAPWAFSQDDRDKWIAEANEG